jgi:hypothetical protein
VKKAKITIEFDGQKTVFTTDSFNMQQSRDVKRKPDQDNPGKTKFEPGETTMVLVAFRPMLIPEECSPIPTIEKAFGIASPDQAEAIQESRRGMISDSSLEDKEGIDWQKAEDNVRRELEKRVAALPEEGTPDPDGDVKYLQLDAEREIDLKEIIMETALAEVAMKRMIGQVVGNWQFLKMEKRGQMFEVRVKNTGTGAVIDIREPIHVWKEHGILGTINKKAEEGGIVV